MGGNFIHNIRYIVAALGTMAAITMLSTVLYTQPAAADRVPFPARGASDLVKLGNEGRARTQSMVAPSRQAGGAASGAIPQAPLCDPNWAIEATPSLEGGLYSVAVV
ncbi:MAG: hypothetical protein ABIO92_00810, partial [Chloroflexia bacterium]